MKKWLTMILLCGCVSVVMPQTTREEAVVLLEQAYELALEKNAVEATARLHEGLLAIQNHPYADSLRIQVYDIMGTEERAAYKAALDKGRYLWTFWRQQDPTQSTPENERYVEHVMRHQQAQEMFSSPHPRGYDDRGVYWIRYGEPDKRITQVAARGIRDNEAWVYYRYDPPIVLNFVLKGATYCLSIGPYDFVLPGDRAIIFGSRGNTKYVNTREIFLEYLQTRTQIHLKYANLYNDFFGSDKPVGQVIDEYVETSNKMAMENNEHPIIGTELVPLGELSANMGVARFWENGQTQLEMYVSIPFDQLTDPSNLATLRFSHAVLDSSGDVFHQGDDMIQIPLRPEIMGKDLYFTTQLRIPLPPKDSKLYFDIMHAEKRKAFRSESTCSELPVSSASMVLSDIQLASDIIPEPEGISESQRMFVKKGLLIRPFVLAEVHPERTLYFYMEAYDLLLNATGQSEFEVSWVAEAQETLMEKINPFQGRAYRLSSSFEQRGQGRMELIYYAVDIQKLMPGPYTMTFTVKDKLSGRACSREIPFNVKAL